MSDEEVAERAKEWPEKFCSLDVNGTRKDVHAALGRPTSFFRTNVEIDDKDLTTAHSDRYEYAADGGWFMYAPSDLTTAHSDRYEYYSEPEDFNLILTIEYYEDDRVKEITATVLPYESLEDFPCETKKYSDEYSEKYLK
jgi:hypothetical protein